MAVFVGGELVPTNNTFALNVVHTAYSSVLSFAVVGTKTGTACHRDSNAIRLAAIFANLLDCFFPLGSEVFFVLFLVPLTPFG